MLEAMADKSRLAVMTLSCREALGRISSGHVNEFCAIRELRHRGLDSITLREPAGDRLARHLGVSSYCFGASPTGCGASV
jgi:hypothetical protein